MTTHTQSTDAAHDAMNWGDHPCVRGMFVSTVEGSEDSPVYRIMRVESVAPNGYVTRLVNPLRYVDSGSPMTEARERGSVVAVIPDDFTDQVAAGVAGLIADDLAFTDFTALVNVVRGWIGKPPLECVVGPPKRHDC